MLASYRTLEKVYFPPRPSIPFLQRFSNFPLHGCIYMNAQSPSSSAGWMWGWSTAFTSPCSRGALPMLGRQAWPDQREFEKVKLLHNTTLLQALTLNLSSVIWVPEHFQQFLYWKSYCFLLRFLFPLHRVTPPRHSNNLHYTSFTLQIK